MSSTYMGLSWSEAAEEGQKISLGVSPFFVASINYRAF